MKIAYFFHPGRLQRLDQACAGNAPTEFFYGAIELAARGHDIRILETDPNTPVHWPCAAFNFLGQHGPVRLDGTFLQSIGNLLHKVNDCDVVIGTTVGHAFALATWHYFGRLRIPIVAIQTGLLNYKINFSRRYTTALLLRRMQSMLFGESEFEPMCKAYPGIRRHIHINQFGVDTSFWTPGPAKESGYVLAVGSDGRRDYATLIEAARLFPWRLILLTNCDLPPLPSMLSIFEADMRGVSDARLRDLYRGASCVVVTLKPTLQPSGQSVTLQAMACGRPAILTNTQGIWSYETVRDGETLLLTAPYDSGELCKTIDRVMKNPEFAHMLGVNACNAVRKHSTIQDFADRLLQIAQCAVS